MDSCGFEKRERTNQSMLFFLAYMPRVSFLRHNVSVILLKAMP